MSRVSFALLFACSGSFSAPFHVTLVCWSETLRKLMFTPLRIQANKGNILWLHSNTGLHNCACGICCIVISVIYLLNLCVGLSSIFSPCSKYFLFLVSLINRKAPLPDSSRWTSSSHFALFAETAVQLLNQFFYFNLHFNQSNTFTCLKQWGLW